MKLAGQELKYVSQTGRTVLTLRELLLKGEYKSGERLSELALVARLGVSRTPIRLALDRLAHEGLLEPSPSGGFLVRSFTLDDVWDALEMRGVLEGMAARFAAERITDPAQDLKTLKEVQHQIDLVANKTIDGFAQYVSLNEAFHQELLRLANSPMLERTLEHLTALPFAGPSALVFSGVQFPTARELGEVGRQQHYELLDALEKRDGARAEAVAREHARLSRRNLELALTDTRVLSSVPGAALVQLDPNDTEQVSV